MNEWFWIMFAIVAFVFVIASYGRHLIQVNPWTIIGWIVLGAIVLYVGVGLVVACALTTGGM